MPVFKIRHIIALLALTAPILAQTTTRTECHPVQTNFPEAGDCTKGRFAAALPPNGHVEFAGLIQNADSNRRCFGEGPVVNPAFRGYARNLPSGTCAVIVYTPGYRFGMLLPPRGTGAGSFANRFLAIGNGGFNGGINWQDMTPGPQYGAAVLSTDTGHNSTDGVTGLRWAANNQSAQEHFGYRAIEGSVQYGKLFTTAYYGTGSIAKSYYTGCSTGGRQGLRQIQLHEDSFDGLLIGAPAWDVSKLMVAGIQTGVNNLDTSGNEIIGLADVAPIRNWAVLICDVRPTNQPSNGRYNIDDELISTENCAPTADDFRRLLCVTAGGTGLPGACVSSPSKVNVMRNVYKGLVINGRTVFPGPQPGGEPDFIYNLLFGIPADFDQQWPKYFLDKPNWTFRDWNTSKEAVYTEAVTRDPGLGTANKTALPSFRTKGKLLLYHGIADGLISVGSSTEYYTRTRDTNPAADLNSWFQYYQLPGMHHCWAIPSAQDNSRPPWYIAGSGQLKTIEWRGYNGFSVPSHEFDPKYDIFQALINWVEGGTGFNYLVATDWLNDGLPSVATERTRKICPYPQKAVYLGGTQNSHTSWECRTVAVK